jgi:hypothetical protein
VKNPVKDHVPHIVSPFPHQLNPHIEHARAHLVLWVRDTGLVLREASRERFDRADFGGFVAAVYPTADAAKLDLMADWFGWLFLVDDQLDDGEIGRRPEQIMEVFAQIRAVLNSPDFDPDLARSQDVPAVVSSLADLWQRTASGATPQWRRRFAQHLDSCLTTAATWEAGNRLAGTVPDAETYIIRRRDIGAIYVCMDFIDIVEDLDVPPEVYRSPRFMAALDAACNVVCWTNDVYSLRKERSRGEVHNLVYIIQHHQKLTSDAALSHVCAAISAEIEHFLGEEAELLAAFREHEGMLRAYLAGMRTWMSGNLSWSRSTKRYQAADDVSPQVYLEPDLMGSER